MGLLLKRGSGQFARIQFPFCHGERRPNDPAELESEGKSNHPDDVSSAIRLQGVLLGVFRIEIVFKVLIGRQQLG